MATTKPAGDGADAKDRDEGGKGDRSARERAAAEARRQREEFVGKQVLGIAGVPPRYAGLKATEVGPSRYRVSLLVYVDTKSEFLDDRRICHSWYVTLNWDTQAITSATGDVPFRELYPDAPR